MAAQPLTHVIDQEATFGTAKAACGTAAALKKNLERTLTRETT